MVQNVNPTFVKTPNRGIAQISTGTGTATTTLYTGGANGSKINGVTVMQNSSGTPNLLLYYSNASVNYFLTTVSVVSNTPTAVLSTIPGLPLDSDGNNYLLLASSADSLLVQSSVTLPTATTLMSVYASVGDF